MTSPSSELRLFGLDLSTAGRQARQAWCRVLRLPALAWLGPRPVVLLHEADGGLGLWEPQGSGVFHRRGDGAPGARAAFEAVELPEEVVLRRQLALPALGQEELARAIEMDAQASSPFPQSELVWGHGPVRPDGRSGQVRVELALASQRSVEQCLAGTGRTPDGPLPEVWVRSADGPAFAFAFEGYGQERRRRAERRGWRVLALLALLALGLLVAIAITPTLQLRQRALQAVAASDRMVEQTRSQVAKREALLAANEQLRNLGEVIGQRPSPLRTLHTLTQVLGDETVLQRLQIEGRTVLIAGHTPDTAAMMQKLSAQPGFKGVRAPSAATRPAGATKESFQVEFILDDEAAASSAASAQPPGEQGQRPEAQP